MNWYLVNVVEITPRNFPCPFPVMKVAARSEAEARQVAELFLDDGLVIDSVTDLGPFRSSGTGSSTSRQHDGS